jgi:hypothetical protein
MREGGVSPSRNIKAGNLAMRISRACLVALLLALSSLMLGQAAAYAASLDDALSHFTTDDFSETSTGISDVATSGSPRAEIIIRALQDGRLLFDRRAYRRRCTGRHRYRARQQSGAWRR